MGKSVNFSCEKNVCSFSSQITLAETEHLIAAHGMRVTVSVWLAIKRVRKEPDAMGRPVVLFAYYNTPG
jgi:hypothetical protein